MNYDSSRDRRRGNCCYATEALFHILGGRAAGWKAMCVTCTKYKTSKGVVDAGDTITHWFLLHKSGLIVDPSRRQFQAPNWWATPDYSQATESSLFTNERPSRRARELMRRLTWQHQTSTSRSKRSSQESAHKAST